MIGAMEIDPDLPSSTADISKVPFSGADLYTFSSFILLLHNGTYTGSPPFVLLFAPKSIEMNSPFELFNCIAIDVDASSKPYSNGGSNCNDDVQLYALSSLMHDDILSSLDVTMTSSCNPLSKIPTGPANHAPRSIPQSLMKLLK